VSQTLQLIQELVADGDIRISEHGYDELSADKISVRDVVDGINTAVLVEDYPNYSKGPCVLVLQRTHTDCRFTLCGAYLRVWERQRSL
jgi:hypothetical protein